MKSTNYKFYSLFTLALLSFTSLSAQEVCNNGVDDDGDGYIDCYDSDCSDNADCNNFFLGNSVACQEEPTANPAFSMRLQWASANESADSYATPMVGDLDQDGIPEVVTINWIKKTLNIINGSDGTNFISPVTLDFNPQWQVAIGDVMGDECAWIFVTEHDFSSLANSTKVVAYDCKGTPQWQVDASKGYGPGVPGLADFNQDGVPELYYRNEIRNAQTGALLVQGIGWDYAWYFDVAFGTLAIDVLGDDKLELVTGGEIYSVNITNGSGTTGNSVTLERNLDDLLDAAGESAYSFRYYRTYISAADYNLDGNMDLVLSGAIDDSNGDPFTTVFFWDVAGSTVDYYQDPANNWARGTGRINLGDVDGDGQMNAVYVSGEALYALDENMDLLWKVGVKETSSGFTGCTMFDFNGDGKTETVYRSEDVLMIISTDASGSATISSQSLACISRTAEEYPVVVDVDGDGASEICVTCLTNDGMSIDGSNYTNTQYSQVRVYEADGGEVWQPSRKVWNQHAYFNVNVNDDLTIPAVQQDHTVSFGSGNCTSGTNRALNGFLNQSTIIDETGCPSYVSPDLDIVGTITATPSQCPGSVFNVDFDIQNTGDTDISGTLPISFYAGDPTVDGSVQLNTQTVSLVNLLEDEIYKVTDMEVEGIGGDFDLYIVLNDYGQTPPISFYSASIAECEVTNNSASVAVTYLPFDVTVEKVSDNIKCDETKPNSGRALAYFDGTEEGEYETFWFETFSTSSAGATSESAGSSLWSSSTGGGSNSSTYGVGTTFGGNAFEGENSDGNNDAGYVTWTSEEINISAYTDVSISIDLLSNDNCDVSGSGQDEIKVVYKLDGGAETTLTNGQQYGDFDWERATASGLSGSTLQIIAYITTTRNNEVLGLDNVSVRGMSPTVSKQFTDVDGYEFYWYDITAPSTILYTGSDYSSMAEGTYGVYAKAADAECFSNVAQVTIDRLQPTLQVWAYSSTPLTDCETPDGSLRAFVYTETDGDGNPVDTLYDGYTFTWYSQDGLYVIGTGDTLDQIDATPYEPRAYHNNSGCTGAFGGTISVETAIEDLDSAFMNATINHITTCGGTGSITANYTGSSTYSYEWYIGSYAKPTPDYTTATITGLSTGTFTVRVIDDATSCASEEFTYTILDNSSNPKPVIDVIANNTACGEDSYNGSATISNPVSGTVYNWYWGTSATQANKLPGDAVPSATLSGNTLSNLPSGLYTVSAKQGGCTVYATAEIIDETDAPEFNFISQVDAGEGVNFSNKSWIDIPQTISGWTELTISYWVYLSNENYLNDHLIFSSGGTSEDQVVLWTDDTDGLSFVVKTEGDPDNGRINSFFKPTGWTQLTGVWSLDDINGDGIAGDMFLYANGVLIGSDNYVGTGTGIFDAGSSMYIARDANLGVNKFEGRIDEFRLYNKAFNPTEVTNAVCSTVDPAEDGLVVYYDFEPGNVTGTEVINVATTVNPPEATRNAGESGTFFNGDLIKQAQGTFDFLTSNIDCPIGYAQNNSSCDPNTPNGAMDLTGKIDPADGNYEFTLYSGYEAIADSIIGGPTANPVFSGLASGFYLLRVEDLDSECSAEDLPFAVADIPDYPAIVTTITEDVSCNSSGTGEIFAQAYSDVVEPSSYTFQLYDGFSYDNPIGSPVTVSDGLAGHTYTGLTDGSYRIEVMNDDYTCTFYKDIIVDDNPTTPTFDNVEVVANTSCSSANGSITLDMPGLETDYTYTWYIGSVADPVNEIDTATSFSLNNIGATTPSANGQYTVVATSIATGCASAPQTATVTDEPTSPVFLIDEVQANSGCTPDGAVGIAEAYTMDGGLQTTSGYTFEWFSDAGLTSSVTSTDDGLTNTAETLESITYYVRVTDDVTGCFAVNSITISNVPEYPELTLTSTQDNSSCDPTGYNGEILVAITGVIDPVADGYTLEWYYSDGTLVTDGGTVSGSATENLTGIPDDTYKVVTTAPNGCNSDTLVVIVAPGLPTLAAGTSGLTGNSVCDPDLNDPSNPDANGAITFTPTGGTTYAFALE
ncbi:LamG-like jellyroll fold domain-containing protein, partial [Marinoscillum sp. MHG1-6]|uniref:LamG-like jellyroll fold domain-containing protein n=1 Tax=Marinoscillum sp. MHG1-6 TaxID=2959627 RepID=UPI00215749CC